MSGCGRSPSTVNVMAPHMHEPECINYGLSHVRSYGFQGRRTRTAIGSGGDCLLLDRRRSKAELQQTTDLWSSVPNVPKTGMLVFKLGSV
jgi:hypothetical protein